MALTDSEIQEIKVELGWHALTTDALPYVSWTALFEQVIQPNVSSLASTTSSTAVTPTTPVSPTAITLASASGFAAGNRIVVDVDDRQETVTVAALSGASATATFTKPHSGIYPVAVECGETLVRSRLAQIRATKQKLRTNYGLGTLKRADDVEWYQGTSQTTLFDQLNGQLMYWRDELAAACGDVKLNRWRRLGGAQVAMY